MVQVDHRVRLLNKVMYDALTALSFLALFMGPFLFMDGCDNGTGNRGVDSRCAWCRGLQANYRWKYSCRQLLCIL